MCAKKRIRRDSAVADRGWDREGTVLEGGFARWPRGGAGGCERRGGRGAANGGEGPPRGAAAAAVVRDCARWEGTRLVAVFSRSLSLFLLRDMGEMTAIEEAWKRHCRGWWWLKGSRIVEAVLLLHRFFIHVYVYIFSLRWDCENYWLLDGDGCVCVCVCVMG